MSNRTAAIEGIGGLTTALGCRFLQSVTSRWRSPRRGSAAASWRRESVGRTADAAPTDLDLMLHFWTEEALIPCGATTATLTGQTTRGQAITGTDSVRTVGCG